MINKLQRAYLDGAAMAYKDVADKMNRIIDNAPDDLKAIVQCIKPLADACLDKADEVYKEAERIDNATRQ